MTIAVKASDFRSRKFWLKGAPVRKYHINAISVKMVYNKHGDHDPNGMMYVLDEKENELRSQIEANGMTPSHWAQPLVIRANLGDKVIVKYKNKLSFTTSIHIQRISYDVDNSDGTSAGHNPNTTVDPGETITYHWYADQLGTCFFSDMGNVRAHEIGSNIHGLWGALIVEEPGSTWTEPETGKELLNGQMADIHHPSNPDFREYVLFLHDEPEVKNKDSNQPINPETGQPDVTMAFNYRSEPMRNRFIHNAAKKFEVENIMMSSWVFGDPATPLLRAYKGDPTKIRLCHAGVKETHVFHLHVHQWRLEANDPASPIIDSISIGPQETYDIEVLGGAGSLHGAIGDIIWHCHLYPHFNMGMWGLWRVHDKLEDGAPERILPDGTHIPALQPLPDREPPPSPDALHPGYPCFIPGTFGARAPKPPLTVTGDSFRDPTELEKANFVKNYKKGAFYTNPAPEDAPIKTFNIVGIQKDIVYNSLGWHDPEGRLYVLEEDVEAILNGDKKPEPLFIRANVGDVIEINLKNNVPELLGGNEFQLRHHTISIGPHVHLVKFDPITSDGGANGWNYDSCADIGQTMTARWYADTELNTVFFHDHLFANAHQQHGIFNALIVEPVNSKYLSPKDGTEIKSGSQAIIQTHGTQPSFREFCIAVHDFALLFDKDGKPLNAPPFPNSDEDPGVMGINYTNEPFEARTGDPAYVFSSYLHGDPYTPILKCYSGDPVRIRLVDGAHEEQHSFNIHGISWNQEIGNRKSPYKSSQTLGISEAFNMEFVAPEVKEDTDYLYYFGGIDDLWLGLWGIIRVYASQVDDLIALPDRNEPPSRSAPLPEKTGEVPPPTNGPGIYLPESASVKDYNIVAIKKKLIYNKAGDHDPDGLIFVLDEDKKRVLSGKKQSEPLVIRVNIGDYIRINLKNDLPDSLTYIPEPAVPLEKTWPPSRRISLAAQLTTFNALGSGGMAVGFNPDSTVGPGESIEYIWYANVDEGTAMLSSWGDVRNHRHHGLFGALIIEPPGAIYRHSGSGRKINTGCTADIICPSSADFREFVVFIQDGIRLLDKEGNLVADLPFIDHGDGNLVRDIPGDNRGHGNPGDHGGHGAAVDYEDMGQKAINYRNEPYRHRLMKDPRVNKIFDSDVHGDPVTPLFRAYPYDPVVFRVIMAADKPRNHSITIHGHRWQAQPGDMVTDIASTRGAISVGNTFDLIINSAGGVRGIPGSYIYRAGVLFPDLEVGMWGIFRVFEHINARLRRLTDSPFTSK